MAKYFHKNLKDFRTKFEILLKNFEMFLKTFLIFEKIVNSIVNSMVYSVVYSTACPKKRLALGFSIILT